MAQTVKDEIVVSGLSKYGVKVGEEYINFSKNLPEKEKGFIVPGGGYEVELYVADSGKRYINHVTALEVPKETPKTVARKPYSQAVKETVEALGKYTKASETMTKAEWKDKDRSQLIGGLSHDAAMLVSAMIPTLGALDSAGAIVAAHKQVLEGLLKTREELK